MLGCQGGQWVMGEPYKHVDSLSYLPPYPACLPLSYLPACLPLSYLLQERGNDDTVFVDTACHAHAPCPMRTPPPPRPCPP